ncbi:MAG: PRC-barrel domain-containing protein [Gammaproteobacteria bacterium]|nr:PRC-barrel domain-containing protein [Gammaproteobacteria bacterium]
MRQLRKLAQLNDYRLHARDGEIGRLKEVFFDDRNWSVLYLVVHTGNWLLGRNVLILPSMIRALDEEDRLLRTDLTREQIENCPEADTSTPISRHFENDYYGYYGLHPYWMADPFLDDLPEIRPVPDELQPREPDQPHLRSSAAVAGYRIHALDGEVGHVEDFIVDDTDWSIRYFEVDTRNWLPGKHVLLAPVWIHSIDWRAREVIVNLERQAIESAPAYNRKILISNEYELALYKHYGKTIKSRTG